MPAAAAVLTGGLIGPGGGQPGMPPPPPQINPNASAYLATLPEQDRANIAAGAAGHSGGGNAGINAWYDQANKAGAIPQMLANNTPAGGYAAGQPAPQGQSQDELNWQRTQERGREQRKAAKAAAAAPPAGGATTPPAQQ